MTAPTDQKDDKPRHTLVIDAHVTCRKYYHHVVAPSGEVVFQSVRLTPIFDFLSMAEITDFSVQTAEREPLALVQITHQ